MAAMRVPLPFSHVLHIGAGGGGDAGAYLAAGLNPVVLAEADPEAAAELQQLAAAHSVVRAVQAAVSARPGPQTYYRTNFSDLNGLRAPGPALRALFPGLEVLAAEPAATVAPEALVAEAGLPQDGAGLLVIEAPGEAAGILQALARAGLLEGFRSVRVQEGRQPLYDGAPGLAELQALLQELGYEGWLEPAPEDPDRPYLFAVRAVGAGGVKRDLQELTGALEASQEAAAAQAEEHADTCRELALQAARCGELEAEAERLAVRVAELEAENRRLAQDLDEAASVRSRAGGEAENLAARMAELEAENRRQAQALEDAASARSRAGAEAENQAARMAELEAENRRQAQALEDAASARSRAGAEVENQAARMAELEAENRRQAQDLDEAASARSRTEAEAERLTARVAELEAETAASSEARQAAEGKAAAAGAETRQAQQSLAVALRLQSRREADLKELQKRYSALLQRQEAQEDLLRRTGACLGYLMDDSAPEEARPVLAAAALRSGSGA
ncbi:hypothetical protein KUW17_20280 [Leisingera aquaemixtae]|uniref:hypothetical protein n=1 Tax=Leisingera aquaemixtae TaxID=1396826 RepID=UPI001C940EA0|nr:hypothetical protein [Leisingera aquaemixtae]MBY6069092.1 hypothetical protein [Leisingera aquaemixtae]